jgi:uncharacterized protein (DUF1697 family)
MSARSASTRYVALLRGINVGGHRVAMSDLRVLFEALAFADVETFIASGNVIFTAAGKATPASLEQRIADHLQNELGYAVPTFLRTPHEIAQASAQTPFPGAEMSAPGHSLYVGFLQQAPDAAFARDMAARATAVDDFAVLGRELFWLCRGKMMDSLVAWPNVEKAMPVSMTMRNITTVRKLAAKYPAVD